MLRAVTTPLVTVIQGTFSPVHPALPLIELSGFEVAAVTMPLLIVRHAGDPLQPKVPLTPDVGVEPVVVELQPQVALDGIITKRARPE